jgi:dipeptidyl aminopeptidase/acylaminoacyl peptidase
MFRTVLVVCLALCGALQQSPAHAQSKQAPPLAAFFDEGNIQAMRLSPNGRWLAAQVVPDGGGNTRLVIIDLQDKEPSKVVATFNRANVRGFQWVNDDLLIGTARQDGYKGVEPRYDATFSVGRDGARLRLLIKADFDSLTPPVGSAPLEANHEFLSLGEPGSDEIIVGETLFDANFEVKAVRPLVLNARTGARRSLTKREPPFTVGWVFDPRGRARLAISRHEGKTSYHWLNLESQEWRVLAQFETLSAPYTPAFVDGAGNLYVQAMRDDGNGDDLRKFNFDTGKPGDEVILSTPGYDSGFGGILDRSNGELLGISLTTDAEQTVWLAPEVDALQKKVDAALPGRVNQLRCGRCDKLDAVLVFSYSDRSPGDYLVYRPRTDKWEKLGARRQSIEPSAMARVGFHRIKARDGGDLPVWVTRPAGAPQAQPAVVLVHGGPWARGREWGWEAQSQFLASRGYVVIEPEFRGSTGYGDPLFRAGFKQWGLAMQDDVTDALQFAVKQGWVDPKRVCIAGASYGGYATLMGLAKDPDQYRCGVAWVGVSDPRLMFSIYWSDISSASKKYSYTAMIGDPVKDAGLLAANAPVELAQRIKAPVLLAYGGKDRRVPLDHGEKMRAALTKTGRAPEWVVYPDEGHGWRLMETRFDFWSRVERFLAQHLAP